MITDWRAALSALLLTLACILAWMLVDSIQTQLKIGEEQNTPKNSVEVFTEYEKNKQTLDSLSNVLNNLKLKPFYYEKDTINTSRNESINFENTNTVIINNYVNPSE